MVSGGAFRKFLAGVIGSVAAAVLGISMCQSASASDAPKSLDPGFGISGLVSSSDFTYSPVSEMDAKGRLVTGSGLPIARYLPNGQLDVSFGLDGKVSFSPSGRYVAGVSDIDFFSDGDLLVTLVTQRESETGTYGYEVVRYSQTGEPRTSFGHGGSVRSPYNPRFPFTASSTLIRPDGKILLAGGSDYPSRNDRRARITLLGSDGATIKQNGRSSWFSLTGNSKRLRNTNLGLAEFTDLAPLSKGRTLVAGVIGNRFVVLKLDRRGRPIKSFGERNGMTVVALPKSSETAGTSGGSGLSNRLSVTPSGSRLLVLAGIDYSRKKLLAFDRNGKRLKGFGNNGSVGLPLKSSSKFIPLGLRVLANGNHLVVGAHGKAGTSGRTSAALLLGKHGLPVRDFGSNGIKTRLVPGMDTIWESIKETADRSLLVGSEDGDSGTTYEPKLRVVRQISSR